MKLRFPQFAQLSVATIALMAVSDVALRFLPPAVFSFRVWEAALVNYNSLGDFHANGHWAVARSYGDLAGLGNRRDLRQYRPESFTTDLCGNRNPPELLDSGQPTDALFVGNSFTQGGGLADEETLPSRYQAATGESVYNAGHFRSFDTLISLAKGARLKRGGIIVLDYLRRYTVSIKDLDVSSPVAFPVSEICRPKSAISAPIWYLHNLEGLSPLSIFSQRFLKYFENGFILPNPFQNDVVLKKLKTGVPILFLPDEIEQYSEPIGEVEALPYFRVLSEALLKYGWRLEVLILPSKYDVYAPLLRNPPLGPSETYAHYARLAEGLRKENIPVINLGPVFRNLAREDLENGKMIYWKDDIHWNPAGVDAAVQQIVKQWGYSQPVSARSRSL